MRFHYPLVIAEKHKLLVNLFEELSNFDWQRIIDNCRPIMVLELKPMND
jgi:hypothetical protein